jgi:hypothetical protein
MAWQPDTQPNDGKALGATSAPTITVRSIDTRMMKNSLLKNLEAGYVQSRCLMNRLPATENGAVLLKTRETVGTTYEFLNEAGNGQR